MRLLLLGVVPLACKRTICNCNGYVRQSHELINLTRFWGYFTYSCKDGRSEENGLDVGPFVDNVFGFHVNAFGGGDSDGLLVIQELEVDVFPMDN